MPTPINWTPYLSDVNSGWVEYNAGSRNPFELTLGTDAVRTFTYTTNYDPVNYSCPVYYVRIEPDEIPSLHYALNASGRFDGEILHKYDHLLDLYSTNKVLGSTIVCCGKNELNDILRAFHYRLDMGPTEEDYKFFRRFLHMLKNTNALRLPRHEIEAYIAQV